jgi:hypothetical protein
VHCPHRFASIVASLPSGAGATDAAMTKQLRNKSRRVVAANDNGPGGRRIVIRGIHPGLAIGEIEVDIFNALIFDLPGLIANDNDPEGPTDG